MFSVFGERNGLRNYYARQAAAGIQQRKREKDQEEKEGDEVVSPEVTAERERAKKAGAPLGQLDFFGYMVLKKFSPTAGAYGTEQLLWLERTCEAAH